MKAGELPKAEMLENIPELIAAYYTRTPDTGVETQKVAFGTSGHRGSSIKSSFNEAHIFAITQAVCEYRKANKISGTLFIDACAAQRASGLRGQRGEGLHRRSRRLYADPGHLLYDPGTQFERGRSMRRRRDHPFAQSPERRRFQVQSA